MNLFELSVEIIWKKISNIQKELFNSYKKRKFFLVIVTI